MAEHPPIEEHWPLVKGKCREVLRQYAGYVEIDDLLQEVHLWWLGQKPELLATYIADPRRLRLRRAVWRVARDTAERYKRQVTTPDPYLQVRYSGGEILQLLPVAVDPDGLPDGGGVHDGPRAHGNLAEGGDVIASLIDVRRVLPQLSYDDQDYLGFLRRCGWDYTRAGAALSIEPDSARRRVARICERIARSLNNEEI